MDTLRASQINTDPSLPGEIRTHWPVAAAGLAGVAANSICTFSLGVFIGPLQHEFGWSRSSITSVLVMWIASAIVALPLVGALLDRYGARRIAIPGLIVHGLALAGLALCSPSLWSWWIGYALVILTQTTCSMMIWAAGITFRFDAQRGLALGIALAGGGVGAALVPSIANWLIESVGWRLAFVSLGGLVWLTALPPVWLWFRPPTPVVHAVQRIDTSPRSPIAIVPFVQLSCATFFLAAALGAITVHFVPLLESVGISRTTGAAVAGLIGVASILGRLLGGQLLDTFKLQYVGAIFSALPILATGLTALGPTSVLAFSGMALLFGASLGAEMDIVSYAAGRYFRGHNYGVMLGVLMACLGIGGGLGPILSSAIFDRTGSYKLLFLVIPALCACSTLLILTLRSPRPQPTIDQRDSPTMQCE